MTLSEIVYKNPNLEIIPLIARSFESRFFNNEIEFSTGEITHVEKHKYFSYTSKASGGEVYIFKDYEEEVEQASKELQISKETLLADKRWREAVFVYINPLY